MFAPASVLVVGAGLGGARTVAALRELGYSGEITLLGAEGLPPYDRPPLSKHLFSRTTPVFLSDDLGIDVTALAVAHLARPATWLDLTRDRPTVGTADGDLSADALVVATGSYPFVPGGWYDAATLHTAADAAALRERLTPGTHLACVGAGWIGSEVASVAAAAGVTVTVLEAGSSPLEAALGPSLGPHFARWFDAAGVELRAGTPVSGTGPGRVYLAEGLVLDADVVLVAIGIRPATGWLADTGLLDASAAAAAPLGPLPVRGGQHLFVDVTQRVLGTDAPVYAVGDVTVRHSPRHGWIAGGHWDNALRTPEIAARALLGLPIPPALADPAPYVFSTQFGHSLALLGYPRRGDEVVLRGDPERGNGWLAFWYTPGTTTLTGILLVDRPRDIGTARRMFAGPDLPVLDRDIAADPSRPLNPAG